MMPPRALIGLGILLACIAAAGASQRTRDARLQTAIRPKSVQPTMHENPREAIIQVALAQTLPPTLTRTDRERMAAIVRKLKSGDRKGANRVWSEVVRTTAQAVPAIDPAGLILWLMREAYVESNEDLRYRADKVRYYNAQKKKMRKHAENLRNTQLEMQGQAETETEPSATMNAEPVQGREERKGSGGEPARETKLRAAQLNTVGDDAQLANTDLQNALQKQQQVMQLMSNVSKMLHDTAKAIISNMRG